MAGSTHTTTVDSQIAGMAIQTSLLGQVIPVGWGRGKLSCNLIDYLNFKATPHTTTTRSAGGKGGGSSTSSTTTYTYSADVMLSICEGPITGIVTVWKDAAKFVNGGSTALAQAGLSAMLGSATQSPWAYLTSVAPTHALSYRTQAYAYANAYDLGSNAVVANHSFEVDFAIQFNPGGGVYDANPKDIVTDFLTNANHGIPSWPSGILGTWTQWSNYCLANGLLLSPVLDQPITGADFIKRLMDETNSDCFFSEGLLKIVPFGDASATGNGATFTPNLTPAYDLDEDDFLSEVILDVMDQTNAANYVQVSFLDRTNEYNSAIATAHDLDNILTFGRRQQTPQQFNDICDPQVARNVAQLWLQRYLYIRDQFKFDLPMDFVALEPRDYVTLTTKVDGLSLNRQLVSILSIDEDADGQDVLHVVAEGIPGHTASHALYPAHVATSFGMDVNVDPGNVATPYLFNTPAILTNRLYQASVACAGSSSNWGGAFIWISVDNVNYAQVGSVNAPATYGVLTANLPIGSDPDTTNTLSVNLSASGGSLNTVTHAEADAGATLCLVGANELLSYGTATLTSPNNYNLTYLRRGQRSPDAAHLTGANFVRLDEAVATFSYPASNAGQTIYVKLQSFNIYGRALQDLSTLSPYTLTLSAVTSSPSSPSVTAEYRSNIIRWANPTSFDLDFVEVLASTTNNSATATVVGRSVAQEWTHQGLTAGVIWYYWIAAVDYAGNSSPLVSAGNAAALSIALYEGIGADGVLTPIEKQEIIREWNDLQNEKTGLDSQATAFAITTEKTAYDTAYSTLSTYLAGLSPAYNDTTQNTTITRTTWNANWAALYSARQTLLNKIDSDAAYSAAPGDGNRVRFSRFEQGTTGWERFSSSPIIANLFKGVGGSVPFVGMEYLRIDGNFTANGQDVVLYNGWGDGASYRIPVTPGERIFLAVKMEAQCAAAASWQLIASFKDASDSTIGTPPVLQSGTGPVSFNTEVGGFAVVPSGSIHVSLELYLFNNTSGAGAYVLALREPFVCGAGVSQTIFPAFSDGPSGEPGAQITRWVDGPAQSTSFAYDYTGAAQTGEFSRDLTFQLLTASGALTATSWSYAVLTGTVNGFTSASGTQSMSGTSVGDLTVASLGSTTATVQITALYNGQSYSKQITLVQNVAAAPVTTGGGGGGATTIASQSSGFVTFGTTTFGDVTGPSTPLVGTIPTGKTSANISVSPLNAMPVSGTTGSWTVECKVMRDISGTPTQIGTTQSASSDWFSADFSGDPAHFSFNISDTGLTAGTTYNWRVYMRVTSGSRTHHVTGSVVITA